MTMERSQLGLRKMGDLDLAKQLARVQQEFARRHAGMKDIPLTGKLPQTTGELLRLHPSLEGKVRIKPLMIGGESKQELLSERINIGSAVSFMVDSADFTTLPESKPVELVIIQVKDLVPKGNYTTAEEIWTRRDELGLYPLPPETAFHYFIKHGNEVQMGSPLVFDMNPIADPSGDLRLFVVHRGSDGLWLRAHSAKPFLGWHPDDWFAFSAASN